MQRIKLTREGERKFHEELKYLKEVRRPEVISAIAEARRKGDLSENAEYDAAKEEQGRLEHKIHQLEVKLKHIEIIDGSRIPDDRVYIGARVELEDTQTGKQLAYTLVDEYEADYSQMKISTASPIGKGLLGAGVGDTVEITVPRGTLFYKVLSITRVY